MRRRSVQRRGISLIWVAVTSVVLIGLSGLALDTGYVYLVSHQLQNAADAAALAGAQQLKFSPELARQAAVTLGGANKAARVSVTLDRNIANLAEGDVVLGRYDRETDVFTATLQAPNAVKVAARRTDTSSDGPLGLLFGKVSGNDIANIERVAIALNEGGTGSGLIALCTDCECGLELSGSVEVNLEGGAAQVNSTADCALCGNGSFSIDTPAVNMAGGECFAGNSYDVTGGIHEDVPPQPDPLAHLPVPAWDPLVDLGAIDEAGTFLPGYYSQGIHLTGGDVILAPGIYVLDGAGLQIGGNTNFLAENVMVYVMGTGFVDIDGSGTILMTPPDPDTIMYPDADVYEGVTIFQARDNTTESRIIGTGLLTLEGSLYFPNAFLEIGGTGDGFGNQLIAWQIWIHGTGEITINYTGDDPAAGDIIFLVK
jgi:hypothetical protein